jgi:hypothetical protein
VKTSHLLLVLGLACGCQSVPPVEPPTFATPSAPASAVPLTLKVPADLKDWSVRLTITHEAKGPSSGFFVEVRSNGTGLTESWSSSSAVDSKPAHRHRNLRVSPQDLAQLKQALLDPRLAREPVSESGEQELQIKLNGVVTSYHNDGHYTAAFGPLLTALSKIMPPTRGPRGIYLESGSRKKSKNSSSAGSRA